MEEVLTTCQAPFISAMNFVSKKPACLPVARINHITRVVRDLAKSISFYQEILGFIQIKRPGKLEAENEGAWLVRDGMAIHLIQGNPVPRSPEIVLCADHISFQPSGTLAEIENCLKSHNIIYKMQYVTEGGFIVPQVFFHDPDDNMLEICPCDCLPLVPIQPRHSEDNSGSGSGNSDDGISPAECSEMSEASASMSVLYSYNDE
jgi:catechol 2,3-dioxygenase-like lactoylglutathione lyase family enzyme